MACIADLQPEDLYATGQQRICGPLPLDALGGAQPSTLPVSLVKAEEDTGQGVTTCLSLLSGGPPHALVSRKPGAGSRSPIRSPPCALEALPQTR